MFIKLIDTINGLDRKRKWLIMMLSDLILLVFALYFAFALRYGKVLPSENLIAAWPLFPTLMAAGLIYSWILGIPKIKLQSFDIQAIQRIALCSLLLILTAMSLSFLLRFSAPRSVPLIFGIIFFSGALFSRVNGLLLLRQLYLIGHKRTRVIIYGAGEAGIQLVSSLQQSKEVKAVAFVDDNKLQQKMIIFGLPVYAPQDLEQIVKQKRIERVLIAIPSLSQIDKIEIAKTLKHLPCAIQIMPSQVDIINGNNILDSFVSVNPEDLLGRDKFDVDLPNIERPYREKSILISGAGGSIGLELCRQIVNLSPKKLVIFDHSEHSLYQAEKELRPVAEQLNVKLVAVLGSVCDEKKVARIFEDEKIEAVFHAAAYKHVPLVEANEVSGIKNNVLGTHIMAAQALKSKIETFVLISTDKAVRPTNIMGATKRLAELIIQDCDKRSQSTKFSMVRFGNVLGSSGSVIPLFKDQIAKGGPLTLTHEEVTRYFMAISEAANLVIIAGSFAQGGEVFVLDMGRPVKIKDLARRMIEKSGLTVRDADNPSGDIEIKVTGLRPGEKLYEELLIDAETLSTPHPKILRAQEAMLSSQNIKSLLKHLKTAIKNQDEQEARQLIKTWVSGYHQPSETS
jgi:FlaA1/EpsC-like NDP-sugar epimerase